MVARKAKRKVKPKARAAQAEPELRGATKQKSTVANFPIVGLGASAGGLEAFEQFFCNVPNESGMAFVLVQHLDPGHVSLLTEILQRSTTMPVVEAQDQMAVEPNSVYVIPPNRDMAIFHGALQLSVPEQPRGHRMPIDFFLRSLAEDQGERAIGAILSGAGTDGTLGLRAIVGAGGLSFVQEPATAKFDGMPSSAIHAGFATRVLPVDKLPQAMLSGAHTLSDRQEMEMLPETDAGLRRILMLLRSITGHDFSLYKKSTINRRIERRMLQHDITSTEVYARYISEHPAEGHALFSELLINVTSFFRDPEAYAALKDEVLPELFARKPADGLFRGWVAGCATGEEAYSLAILLHEFMEESGQDCKVQLYSTDIDERAIDLARAGKYPPNIVQDVEPRRLRRYFVKEESGYRVKKTIREMVVFVVHSVVKDPPFSRLDVLSCRNLMIYLKPELQDRLLATFHFAIDPGGVLFLSTSEGIGGHTDLFAPLNRKWKLYRTTRVDAVRHGAATVMPAARGDDKTASGTTTKVKETSLAELTDRVLLQFYAPASLVTDLKGNILHVHGETGKYLRPAPGKPTLNVVDMAHEELQLELRAAIQGAASKGTPTLGREVSAKADDDFRAVSFSVRPVRHPELGNDLLLVSFQTAAGAGTARPTGKRAGATADVRRLEELERELAHARDALHLIVKEQESSNEELKSTNEELQSINEELQSTNEELETSREELQSINEELVTVNGELQDKIQQLISVQNDMKNLLDSTNIGTVFLDERMIIRRFTRDAALIYHLVTSDIGRPLGAIKSHLEGDDLLASAETVLETLVSHEREVHTAGGAWYLARIQPYRTLDNVIEGVVLTFVDVTEMKRVREELHEARELADGIVDTVREPLMVLDAALHVISASRSYYQHFRTTPEATVGRPIYELRNHEWDIPALRELLETVLPRDRSFEGYSVEQDIPAIGRVRMLLSARRIVSETGHTQLILLGMQFPVTGEREKM